MASVTCGQCAHWRGWFVAETRYAIGTCEEREADVLADNDACPDFEEVGETDD